MKKRVFACVLLAVMLTGCGADPLSSRADHVPPESSGAEAPLAAGTMPPQEQIEGITLKAEPFTYPSDVSRITLLATNDTDTDFCLAESFTLWNINEIDCEYVTDYVPYKEGGDYFNETAQIIPAHESAEVIVDLAAHYDLPLEQEASDSLFRVSIGGLSADFTLSPEAPEPEPKAEIQLETEQEHYPAGIDEITVRITNTGTKDYTFGNAALRLEQFLEGSVAVYTYAGQDAERTQTIAHDESIMQTVRFSDYRNLKSESGEYAVYLDGNEARFTVN